MCHSLDAFSGLLVRPKNAFAVGALPRTQLGRSLQRSPMTSQLVGKGSLPPLQEPLSCFRPSGSSFGPSDLRSAPPRQIPGYAYARNVDSSAGGTDLALCTTARAESVVERVDWSRRKSSSSACANTTAADYCLVSTFVTTRSQDSQAFGTTLNGTPSTHPLATGVVILLQLGTIGLVVYYQV